jgi:cytochrome d ubiquinol oxidase subunit I
VGGIPDLEARRVVGAIEIPHGLSFLVTHTFDAEIAGLDRVPRADWPDVVTVHLCFDAMVGIGSTLAGLTLLAAFLWWRGGKRLPEGRRFLAVVALCGPLGFVALEAGWMVTERGRQPWIVTGLLRTARAVTPMPWVGVTFAATVVVYAFLGGACAFLLWRQIAREPLA